MLSLPLSQTKPNHTYSKLVIYKNGNTLSRVGRHDKAAPKFFAWLSRHSDPICNEYVKQLDQVFWKQVIDSGRIGGQIWGLHRWDFFKLSSGFIQIRWSSLGFAQMRLLWALVFRLRTLSRILRLLWFGSTWCSCSKHTLLLSYVVLVVRWWDHANPILR